MTAVLRAARGLASFIGVLPDFQIVYRSPSSYSHMGGVLSDTVLQAGVRYATVVRPRVESILLTYPDGRTTGGFWDILERVGAEKVLQWKHPEKPARLVRLTRCMLERQIESVDDLADWLRAPSSESELLAIPGVGPKTVDYLAGLAGVDAVAVDRHVIRFLHRAGLEYKDYIVVRNVVSYAADLMGVSRRDLDHSIWLYQSRAETNA